MDDAAKQEEMWVSYKLLRDAKKCPSRSNYYKENKEKRLEYQTQYYQTNRKKILEYHVEYRQEHRDILLERAKKKVTCECGIEVNCTSLWNHRHSNRHLESLKKIILGNNI
jgi:hypothetical protein